MAFDLFDPLNPWPAFSDEVDPHVPPSFEQTVYDLSACCCVGCTCDSLPSTATATFTINGVDFVISLSYASFGGHCFYLGSVTCDDDSFLSVTYTSGSSDDPTTGNAVVSIRNAGNTSSYKWSTGILTDGDADYSCVPFHLHFEGDDVASIPTSSPPETLCGIDFDTVGTNHLVLDITTP